MEGHRGKWNKQAPTSLTLLLICMSVPSLTLLQPSKNQTCPNEDYLTERGICCNKCPRGFKLAEECHEEGQRTKCTRCLDGEYTDEINFSDNCNRCRRCKESKNEELKSKCESHKNTICQCKKDYYKYNIDSGTYECRKCMKCGLNEKVKQTCTPENNTVCECKENYYRVNKKCEPCQTCTTECTQHCSSVTTHNTKAPDGDSTSLINAIAGVAAAVLVLLTLVVLITYMITKRFTKKKLQKLSTEQSSDSPDSSKVLINVEDHWNNHQAVPQIPLSEQETSNLPDCVPLEIKIPDLIYTVLDLVPVLQVKQLVRTLGVKDTDIEQAEMDHRSCREAHYQMLRVWAERGSRAGRGGQGGMLHWPLLEELLDQLRTMHLGRAAEELEMKYGYQ